jgi:hypothetical protein
MHLPAFASAFAMGRFRDGGAPSGDVFTSRRLAAAVRESEDLRRSVEEERRRAEGLQEQVWELQGLLQQSQSNYDALVREQWGLFSLLL